MFADDYEEDVDFSVKRKSSIEIPEFLKTKEPPLDLDEESQAILNNTPGNAEIEEMNHLNELEAVCQNWKEEEWKRVLYYAPSKLMTSEIQRRMSAAEEYRTAMLQADEVMKKLKL